MNYGGTRAGRPSSIEPISPISSYVPYKLYRFIDIVTKNSLSPLKMEIFSLKWL